MREQEIIVPNSFKAPHGLTFGEARPVFGIPKSQIAKRYPLQDFRFNHPNYAKLDQW